MLLYLFPAVLTLFPKTFIIKGNGNNGRNTPFCPFPNIPFINEESAGCINEEAIGATNEAVIDATIVSGNSLFCFLFHVSLFQEHYEFIDLNLLVTLQF